MMIKRLYDYEAPKDKWRQTDVPCESCGGQGVVVNIAGTGVVPCGLCTPPAVAGVASARGTGLRSLMVPPVFRVEVRNLTPVQQFSPRFIARGSSEGWLVMGHGKITIGDGTSYKIVREPGLYCCHCQVALDTADAAQRHVARAHHGIASPDAQNPSGYRRDNFYTGARVEGSN